jgi:Flp pilus assembly protein TadD
MITSNKSLFLLCSLWLLFSNVTLNAQTDDDIEGFLKTGKAFYRRGKLNEAALEFENVLIIDRSNFQARIWLAQIYIDKKDFTNARKLLIEASLQAPDHPRVKELQKLLGDAGKTVKPDLVDPVIAETIAGIASATKHREYGLVIPENKVIEENLEKRLLVKSDQAFNEKKEILDNIEKSKEEAKARFDKHFAIENSQLAPVFDIYRNQGLSAALDKYYELLMKDPTLASKDDKGLIDDGNKVYSIRFADNPNDPETRYYYGTLQYINGLYEEAETALKPFRKNPGKFAARLAPFFDGLDKWQEQEKMRLAVLKYEEEQRQEREAKEKEKAETESNDVWAKIKNKSNQKGSNKNTDLAKEDKTQAAASHSDGYKLYKKGKLDEAIAKYEEALSKDGNNPEYNYHLGLAWMDKGFAGDTEAYDKAVSYYQKTINAAPDSKLAEEAKSMIDGIQQTKQSLGEK